MEAVLSGTTGRHPEVADVDRPAPAGPGPARGRRVPDPVGWRALMTATPPPGPVAPSPPLPLLGPEPATVRSPLSLTQARVRAGLTMTELARRLHVSRPTVSTWEHGSRAASRGYWPALGTVLGLGPAEVGGLFGELSPSRLDGRRLPALGPARRRAGLTQREVAGHLGVAPTTVSMWETAGVPVPGALLAQLSQLLATDVTDLSWAAPAEPSAPDPRPLRSLRQDARMSQREAAAHLRTSVGALARYEAGVRATPIPVVRRMAAVYQRTVAEVLRCSGTELRPLPPTPWSADQLPDVLQALRAAAGLTKVEVGRAVGRSGQAVRSWEIGRTRPAPATLRGLEVVLGLPPGRLPVRPAQT